MNKSATLPQEAKVMRNLHSDSGQQRAKDGEKLTI